MDLVSVIEDNNDFMFYIVLYCFKIIDLTLSVIF